MTGEINWIKDCPRRMMIGHTPDYDQVPGYKAIQQEHNMGDILSKFDPKGLIREIKKTHVQALWFYSKCHYGNAYYPSKVKGAHIHSALKGRDLFGELVEACLSEDIVPLCVYEFSDLRMPLDHPDWCHRVLEDREIEGDDVTDAIQGAATSGPCLNGPYGDYVLEQTAEVMKQYPVKGYYIDFLGLFTFGKWICPYCAPKFKHDLGFTFNGIKKMTHEQKVKYIKWHYAQNDQYAKKVKKLIKDLRPDAAFVHNFHGNSTQVNLQRSDFASDNCDFVTGDIFQFRQGLLPIEWKLRQYSALSNDLPGEVLLDGYGCRGGDMGTLKALDSYKAELYIARSLNNATVCCAIHGLDGSFEPEAFALNKRVYEEQKKYEPWLKDIKRFSTVGLVRSHNSIEFRPEEETESFTTESHHAMEFEGWVQVLIASHQLWDVVSEHQLTSEYLKKFKVLILPNISCMGEEQIRTIEDFVKNGGKLIVTGETSLFNEDGERQNNFQLASVLGVDFAGSRKLLQKCLKLTDHAVLPKRPWETKMLYFIDGQLSVNKRNETKALGVVYENRPTQKVKPGLTMLPVPTAHPGLTLHSYGKGLCYYFSGTPGFHYHCIGQNNIKETMKRIILSCADDFSPVTLDAPESVELFAHEQSGKNNLVVCLVNTFGAVSRSSGKILWSAGKVQNSLFRFDEIEEMPVIAEATIHLKKHDAKKIKRVYLAPEEKEVEFDETNDHVTVKIRNLTVYTMLVVEYI